VEEEEAVLSRPHGHIKISVMGRPRKPAAAKPNHDLFIALTNMHIFHFIQKKKKTRCILPNRKSGVERGMTSAQIGHHYTLYKLLMQPTCAVLHLVSETQSGKCLRVLTTHYYSAIGQLLFQFESALLSDK
jgi:hypothetical protein